MSKIKEGSLVILHLRDVWSSHLSRTIKRGEIGVVVEVCEVNSMLSSMFSQNDKMFKIMFNDGIASIFSDLVRILKIDKTSKSERNLEKYLQKKGRQIWKK
jgi:hypothetical protein